MNLQIRIYRKRLWQRFVEWWNLPPQRDRILATLRDSGTEMRGLHICDAGRVGRGVVYTGLARLQEEGLVESRPATDDEIAPVAFGSTTIRFRLYRLTPEGFRVAREVQWNP